MQVSSFDDIMDDFQDFQQQVESEEAASMRSACGLHCTALDQGQSNERTNLQPRSTRPGQQVERRRSQGKNRLEVKVAGT